MEIDEIGIEGESEREKSLVSGGGDSRTSETWSLELNLAGGMDLMDLMVGTSRTSHWHPKESSSCN